MALSEDPRPLPLRPGFKTYAWGDEHLLAHLFPLDPVPGGPCAEAWLGAHPAQPSQVETEAGALEPLDALLRRHPALLGDDVRSRFGELPYLLKVLAVARPLSIQVHPNRLEARAGFEREAQLGVDARSPLRSYRDVHHKPELLVALSDFYALVGFRPLDEIGRVLAELPDLREHVPPYLPTPEGLRRLLEAYQAVPAEVLNPLLERWMERLRRQHDRLAFTPAEHAYWLVLADALFSRPGAPDRGLLLLPLLNLVFLAPGEGVFVAPGVPHAYLLGSGVEVMSNSDNVLRGGLTAKHVDPSELLKVVRLHGHALPKLSSAPTEIAEERSYPVLAEEFQLTRIELKAGEPSVERRAKGPEILLVADPSLPDDARVEVRGNAGLALPRGGACLVPDGCVVRLFSDKPAVLFRVTVPSARAAAQPR